MTVATSYKRTPNKGSHCKLVASMVAALAVAAASGGDAAAQPGAADPGAVAEGPPPVQQRVPPKLTPPEDAKPFPRSDSVWVNREKRVVYVDGVVSLREGLLEMLACPRGTKEHESVVAVNTRAYLVHAALLSVGAEPGRPVSYKDGEYVAPTGDVIKITIEWLDPQGKKHSAKAQEWVRDMNTKKAMPYEWVFAGSGFWTDEETGKQYYQAEGGELVCVANFSTAMIDVAAESTAANSGLLFETFTENIPPLGTPVRLVMTPEKGKEAGGAKPEQQKPVPPADTTKEQDAAERGAGQ